MKKLSLLFLTMMLCASAPSWAVEWSEYEQSAKSKALELESQGNSFFDEGQLRRAEECFGKAANIHYDVNLNFYSDDYQRLTDRKFLVGSIRALCKEGRDAEREADEVVKAVWANFNYQLRYGPIRNKWRLRQHYDGCFEEDLDEAKKQQVEGYKHALACYKEADALKEDLFYCEIRNVKRKLREIGEESDSEDSI